MSYILDALRRADAERSRGAVPGLHAQNIPVDATPAPRSAVPLTWIVGAVVVVIAAGGLALAFGPWRAPAIGPAPTPEARIAPAPELAPVARGNAQSPLAQGELPPPQPGSIDPGARPIEPPVGRGQPLPAYPPQQTAARASPPAPVPRPAARVATLEPKVAKLPPAEHYGAPIPRSAAPAPVPARAATIPNINDLPPNVRATLPRLAVGGAIYSETPSARMVILNGQVFHEGDKPATDTVLEQIRLKSAVLDFRGQRYEVSF
jgi:general secretion pathway protein B